MSRIPVTLTAVATTAALVAGGAGVVLNAGAAKPTTTTAKKASATKKKVRPIVRAVNRAVHAELTVPTKDGLKEVTIDRGTLKDVAGTHLTITEGTKKIAGKDVGVDVPADAKVRVDKKAAHLTDLKSGQHVAVITLPKQTIVRAVSEK